MNKLILLVILAVFIKFGFSWTYEPTFQVLADNENLFDGELIEEGGEWNEETEGFVPEFGEGDINEEYPNEEGGIEEWAEGELEVTEGDFDDTITLQDFEL